MRVLLRAGLLALATLLIIAGTAAAQAPSGDGGQDCVHQFRRSFFGRRPAVPKPRLSSTARSAYTGSRSSAWTIRSEMLVASFERDAPKLDSAARETRRKSIGQREVEYQTRARGLDSTMQARQAQLVKPIMERVQSVIEAIRTEDGYAMIFDVGSQTSVVVAADKKLDLTERVLARLKSQACNSRLPGAVPQPAGVTRPKR